MVHHTHIKMVGRVVDKDTSAEYAVIDFNTRNAPKNVATNYGMNTQEENRHSKNSHTNITVAPSGYENSWTLMK